MSLSPEEQLAAALLIPLTPCSPPSSSPPPPQSPLPHPNCAMLEPWDISPWGSPPRFTDLVRQAPSPPSPRTPVLLPAPPAPGIARPSRLDAARRQLALAPRPPSAEELITAIRHRLTIRPDQPPRRRNTNNLRHLRPRPRQRPQPRPIRPTRHRYYDADVLPPH
ncbi:uncharacterized protein LOC135805814 [Sycon ciliatum]|uniref:uncharacterized protein LOC135805814 n=1 Tax=Sycon ciliatum TaxID=27933 RepID=UPI0031F6CA8F